jgi:NADP-dependent 3-hydroxy acid dehydrogenase YdfG
VADVVAFVTSRPDHVNLGSVIMMPTRQAAMV